MNRGELRDAVETLQNLLIARATGSVASDPDYQDFRAQVLGEPALRDLLPPFLRTARDLAQFWAYIKRDFSRYDERREHIWAAFRPVLDFLEKPEGTPPPPEQASESLASLVDVPEPEPQELKPIRAFISYSTKDKVAAGRVKDFLASYGLECFLAHEDLQVSEEWKERILEELLRCNIFIPLLSKNFRDSDWAPQEIGVISGRKAVAVVPISLDGTVPYGFISSIQGRIIPQAGLTEELIVLPLLKRFPRLIIPGMIKRVKDAGSYRGGEAALRPLAPYFNTLTDPELIALMDAAIENSQVWSAGECRNQLLPQLIATNGSRIPSEKLKALSYQIEKNRWYPAEA